MRDLETESLWSHILGECMYGKLQGALLEVVPAFMTTWQDWRAEYPATTLLNLSRTSREFDRDVYQDPAKFVYGIKVDGQTKAYPFDVLARQPVLQDLTHETEVLVVFDPQSTRAAVYERRLGERTFTFEPQLKDGKLEDQETHSRWDPWSGVAAAGPLKDQTLRRLYGIVSFRSAWEVFYPDTLMAE